MPAPAPDVIGDFLRDVALPPTPLPGPCKDAKELGLWFLLFARDCRAALPAANG